MTSGGVAAGSGGGEAVCAQGALLTHGRYSRFHWGRQYNSLALADHSRIAKGRQVRLQSCGPGTSRESANTAPHPHSETGRADFNKTHEAAGQIQESHKASQRPVSALREERCRRTATSILNIPRQRVRFAEAERRNEPTVTQTVDSALSEELLANSLLGRHPHGRVSHPDGTSFPFGAVRLRTGSPPKQLPLSLSREG